MGLGECLSLLVGHGPLGLQVTLVADQHDGGVDVGVLASILQPCRQMLKRIPSMKSHHEVR